ncbi:uncharacterized protein [Primulina huaijiensis]|uniref:uncharacterized protein n=1 Tax=Primulina huaijiensis TaxID=1492673 RepID=UPI003CC73140
MLAWTIWKEICILKHNSQIPNKCINVEWVLSYLEQFRTARCAWNLASGEVQSSRDMRWVPPPLGQWRLDVDVGFNDTIAIGIRRPGSVLEAELSAIHFGLMLAVRGNFSDVWVFSDSCNAVKEVMSKSEARNHQGLLVLNILDILTSGRFKKLNHVSRNANKLAHYLAHFALSHPSRSCWMNGFYPSWLMDVATVDLINA